MSLHWTEEQYQDYIGQHPPKRNKYGNQKITIDGITRDSLAESNRLEQLKILERVGAIKNLQFQVPFMLIEKQQGENRNERAVKYIADFVYDEQQADGSYKHIVEDCKGKKTKDYIIKRKLMLFVHGISIKETNG